MQAEIQYFILWRGGHPVDLLGLPSAMAECLFAMESEAAGMAPKDRGGDEE